MAEEKATPEKLIQIDHKPPSKDWTDPQVEFVRGFFNYSSVQKNMEYLDLPNPRQWKPGEEDWQLPDNWKEIIFEGLRERLKKYRSFKVFMDICVRCGAAPAPTNAISFSVRAIPRICRC